MQHYVDLSSDEERILRQVVDNHPMNIPWYYLSLINESDLNDPIRKLALPSEDELVIAGAMGETAKDPMAMTSTKQPLRHLRSDYSQTL